MKVIVACEKSGRVRDAFASLGHDAVSCDIQPTDVPGKHIVGDIRSVDLSKFDLMIAHPPCTYLSVSGARWWATRQGEQLDALSLVNHLLNANVRMIALENPVGKISTAIGQPDQIIQPYQFGHAESKKTCLWLKGLPLLKPTHVLTLPERGYWDNQTSSGQNKLGPSENRAEERSKTYLGIAKAMAEQWGGL